MKRNHFTWRRSAGSIFLALSASACSEASDPAATPVAAPVATRLEMSRDSVTVVVPATAAVTAVVRDQRGAAIPGEPVAFTSRDPTVARVDSVGLITAVAAGETRVVARSGTLSDSTAVIVRYHVFEGEARARARSSDGLDLARRLDPVAEFQNVLGGTEEDRSVLAMFDETNDDFGVAVLTPGGPAFGGFDVGRLDIDELLEGIYGPPAHPVGYVLRRVGGDLLVYTSLPGSRVDIEQFVAAPGMGATGTIGGRIVMRAQGYRVSQTLDAATPSGDTLTVYVDFAAEYQHFPIGRATVTAEGGPLAGTTTDNEAWLLPATYYPVECLSVEGDFYVDVYLPGPQVGETTLRAATPWTSPSHATAPYLAVTSYSPFVLGYSQSGTVTLDEVRQPSGEVWGEVRGHTHATVSYWDGYAGGDPSSSGTVSVEFDAPMIPASYFGAGAARVQKPESLWDRLLHRGRKGGGATGEASPETTPKA